MVGPANSIEYSSGSRRMVLFPLVADPYSEKALSRLLRAHQLEHGRKQAVRTKEYSDGLHKEPQEKDGEL